MLFLLVGYNDNSTQAKNDKSNLTQAEQDQLNEKLLASARWGDTTQVKQLWQEWALMLRVMLNLQKR